MDHRWDIFVVLKVPVMDHRWDIFVVLRVPVMDHIPATICRIEGSRDGSSLGQIYVVLRAVMMDLLYLHLCGIEGSRHGSSLGHMLLLRVPVMDHTWDICCVLKVPCSRFL